VTGTSFQPTPGATTADGIAGVFVVHTGEAEKEKISREMGEEIGISGRFERWALAILV